MKKPELPRLRLPKITFGKGAGDRPKSDFAVKVEELLAAPALSFYLILGSSLLLLVFGIFVVFSVTSVHALSLDASPLRSIARVILIASVGLVGMAFIAFRKVETIQRFGPLVFLFTLILQALILSPLARSEGGNTNWIFIPGINQSIQPSEFLKIGLCMYLAFIIVRKPYVVTEFWPFMGWVFAPLGFAAALVLLGHDLGTMLIIAAMFMGIVLVSGMSWRRILGLLLVGVGAVTVAIFLSSSRRERFRLFFTGGEGADPYGRQLQPRHARWALGSGGVFGTGPGGSREKWGYLPAAQTDYIFAIFGEEYGFVGAALVLLVLAALGYGMYRVIKNNQNAFAQLVTAGIMTWIMTQAIVNILVVVGLAPVLGVPLPLMSSGGSSLLASLLALGIVLACARNEPQAAKALKFGFLRSNKTKSVVGKKGK